MSIEQRMAHAEEEDDRRGLHPLLKDRLHKPRSVFSPGHRIRMNILPMFLNIFVPWGIFIFVLGVSCFWVQYSKPYSAYALMAFCILFWLVTVAVAINRRKHDPEPSWYWYFAIMVGLAVFFGILIGMHIFNTQSLPYYMVKDLKVIPNLDVNQERGQNVMDAGQVYFAEGTHLDAARSWHFKHGIVYCVIPIVPGGHNVIPASGTLDFWAVGTDCCSTSSSDFRCGAYKNPQARSGIRLMDDNARANYRLAVEQAETLYGITSTHPVFFEWTQDPLETVNSWNEMAFSEFIFAVGFAFVICLFGVSMASCRFSWMGRSSSIYGEEIFNDPDWQKGGKRTQRDYHTHERKV